MSLLVADCPRCGAESITFDVKSAIRAGTGHTDWLLRFEAFAVCRRCTRSSVVALEVHRYEAVESYRSLKPFATDAALNADLKVLGFLSAKDRNPVSPPEHVPEPIDRAFREGATCLAVECFNAAATMFRLCLDLATRDLLPAEGEEPQANSRQRRDLGLRLPWLIANGKLPSSLAGLASVVREDGNDGAHAGHLGKEDAEDLLDFTRVLLERLYTEPARVALAEARRVRRRQPVQDLPPAD